MTKTNNEVVEALNKYNLTSLEMHLAPSNQDFILNSAYIYLVEEGEVETIAGVLQKDKSWKEYSFCLNSENMFLVTPKKERFRMRLHPRLGNAKIRRYSINDIAKITTTDGVNNIINKNLLQSVKHITKNISLLATGHHHANYISQNREFNIESNQVYASDLGYIWCYFDKKKVSFLDIIPLNNETLYLPMTSDLFFKSYEDSTITILGENQIAGSVQFKQILLSTMTQLTSAVPKALQKRHDDWHKIDKTITKTKKQIYAQATTSFKRLIAGKEKTIEFNPQATEIACSTFRILNYIGFKGADDFISSSEASDLDSLESVSMTLGLRHRNFKLKGLWWEKESGPILAYYGENKQAVALIPSSFGSYRIFRKKAPEEPASFYEESEVVTAEIAQKISTHAVLLYPKFSDDALTMKSVLGFCFKSSSKDLAIFVATSLITGSVSLILPFLSSYVINIAVPDQNYTFLFQIAAMLISIHAANLLIQYTTDKAMLRINGKVGVFVQAAVIDRILRFPLHNHAKNPYAMTSIKVGMLDGVRKGIMSSIGRGVPTIIFLCYATGLIFYYSPLAAAIAAGLVLLILTITCLLAYAQFKAFFDGQAMVCNSMATVVQAVENIRGLRTLGLEKNMFSRWSQGFNQLKKKMMKSKSFDNIYQSLMAGMQPIFTGLLFLSISGMEIDASNIGIFMAFTSSASLFYSFATQFIQSVYGLLQQAPSFKMARSTLVTKPQAVNKVNMEHQYKGIIELKGVSYRFPDGKDMVFRNANTTINYGDLVTIVGDIGTGKSSLLKCLTGLSTATMGSIFFDDVEIKKLNQEKLFEKIGYVNQWNYLFSGTILDNIQGDQNIKSSKVWDIVKVVGLLPTLNRLSLGLMTEINPENPPLSASDIQKVLIARALVTSPKFIFIDDGMRFLDDEDRTRVEDYILSRSATKIIVTNSKSTIAKANRIIMINDQAVVEKKSLEEIEKDPKLGPAFAKIAA